MARTYKIGLVGTGFIANGFARLLMNHHKDLEIVAVLTRRDLAFCDFPLPDKLTNSADELVDKSDLVVECSGDVIHATEVIDKVLQAGIPCVTMNSEFHVTTGSYFVDKGYLTEAEGDQPGCLAALHEDVVQMGFNPQVYGNMKGYLNHHPKKEDMVYWAEKQGFSLSQTTSFTDGTKLQIEQAFIANGMGATITKRGMEGYVTDNLEDGAKALGKIAAELSRPIADFVVSQGQPPGVFITATHDESEAGPLSNIKMGEGPYYVLMRNYHLCAIEIAKTVRRTLAGGPVLLDNSKNPTISIASIAKETLTPGTAISRGIGGFQVRGEAMKVSENRNHVPIGLLYNATVTKTIEPGQVITYDDIEIPDSLAARIAKDLYS
ncbi:MAG: NAD(P)-dependent oxidoreductase [bacterium]